MANPPWHSVMRIEAPNVAISSNYMLFSSIRKDASKLLQSRLSRSRVNHMGQTEAIALVRPF